MNETSSMPGRVNDLEKDVHMLKHQMGELKPIPGEVIVIKERLNQIGELTAKMDAQNQTLISVRDLVMKTQSQVKTYVAWFSGGGAVVMFLLVYGDKVLKFLSRGGL